MCDMPQSFDGIERNSLRTRRSLFAKNLRFFHPGWLEQKAFFPGFRRFRFFFPGPACLLRLPYILANILSRVCQKSCVKETYGEIAENCMSFPPATQTKSTFACFLRLPPHGNLRSWVLFWSFLQRIFHRGIYSGGRSERSQKIRACEVKKNFTWDSTSHY